MAVSIQRALMENFEVYLNDSGSSRLMGLASVDLPEFSAQTEDLSGAGLMGQVAFSTPGFYESAELTLHWRTLTPDFTELMKQDAHDLTLRSSQLNYDSATGKMAHEAVKINVRGLLKSGTLGKLEPATTTDTETTLEVLYLKMSIGGTDVLEVDKFNYIDKAKGKDQMIATRTNLGL